MAEFRTVWIACSVSRGMFPGEYAVEINFGSEQTFSLFVQETDLHDINLDKGTAHLRAELPLQETSGDQLFLYLPQETLQTGKRWVKVPSAQVLQPQ